MIKLMLGKAGTLARAKYFDWKYKGGDAVRQVVKPNSQKAVEWYPLVDPYKMGTFDAAHRVCAAPFTSSRAQLDNHSLSPMQIEYYKIRLTKGSVIFSEALAVSKQGCISRRVCGMFTDEHEDTIKELFETANNNNALLIPQLIHGGKLTIASQPLSVDGVPQPSKPPSYFPPEQFIPGDGFKPPTKMELSDMKQVLNEHVEAAQRLKRAGAKVCNICMGGNSLLHNFLLKSTNPRTDKYGDKHQDRARFPLEVFDAVSGVFGKENVGVTLSHGYSTGINIDTVEHDFKTYIYLARELNKRKAHHITSWYRYKNQAHSPANDDFVHAYEKWTELAGNVRKEFTGTLIGTGFSTLDVSEAVNQIVDGHCDMIMFGFAYVCNPDLPKRLRNGVGYQGNMMVMSKLPNYRDLVDSPDWSEADQARGYIDWKIADLPDEIIHL